MTENEAIKKLEPYLDGIDSDLTFMELFYKDVDRSEYLADRDAFTTAITALKEVQQYRKIGTVEECREAVEKQKVKYIKIESYCPAYCPTCRFELSESLGDGYYEYFENLSRCPKCGQKICRDEDLEEKEDE